MNRTTRLVYGLLRSPVLWGLLGSGGFYALVFAGPLDVELIKRYFAHHPVEYMETVLFSVGLAALVLKAFDIATQRSGLRDALLGATADPTDECDALLARLDRLPYSRHNEYYVARVRAALEHVRCRGAADLLDDELKYLSDLDASRLQNGYGLFRVIVWAIPILGFLGTVIGITMALNAVDLKAPDQSMLQVLNGLGLKFDTTALALTLSMILMFIHFGVERSENALLDAVDRRVHEEFSGSFRAIPSGGNGQVAAIRQMAEAMLQTSEVLLRRQAELWQAAVDSAAGRWSEMATGASEQVRAAMSSATAELAQPVAVLERAVTAAGEVAQLEHALNQNLTALAGTKHLEQTLLSLAAAVNVLSARAGETQTAEPIRLETKRRTTHAA